MFDKDKFCGLVRSAGITMETLAEILGINPATLSRKVNGNSDFTRNEMQLIKSRLNVSPENMDAIFFAGELA